MLPLTCMLGQHKFTPFEWDWIEEHAVSNRPMYAKKGQYRTRRVYCEHCGEIRELIITEKYVRLGNIKKDIKT